MNRYVKDFIKVYDDTLEPEFCASLISEFEGDWGNQISCGDDNPLAETETGKLLYKRFTEINFAMSTHWQAKHGEYLKSKVLEYTNKYYNDLNYPGHLRIPRYAYEGFRLKRYLPDSNDRIDDHTDSTNVGLCKRFLSLFWYLNDVESGGHTKFTELNYYVKPKIGRLLVFPPNFMFPHAGNPVESGTKYLLHTYLHFAPEEKHITNFDLLSDLYPQKSGAVREKTINKE